MRRETAPPERTHAVFIISARIGLLLVAIVVAAFILFGWRLNEIQQDYTRKIARSALTTSCESGNDFRTLDKARWDKIVKLFGPPDSQNFKAFIDGLNSITAAADKQRDCNDIAALTTPPTTSRATVPSTARSEGTP